MWRKAPPRSPNLVYGYYIRADQSGGRPRVAFSRRLYEPRLVSGFFSPDVDGGASGIGPLRWQGFERSMPKALDDHRSIRIGVSHWLVALLLLAMPALWLHRFRGARRARSRGLCRACGYDLRATPDRCPECGTISPLVNLEVQCLTT